MTGNAPQPPSDRPAVLKRRTCPPTPDLAAGGVRRRKALRTAGGVALTALLILSACSQAEARPHPQGGMLPLRPVAECMGRITGLPVPDEMPTVEVFHHRYLTGTAALPMLAGYFPREQKILLGAEWQTDHLAHELFHHMQFHAGLYPEPMTQAAYTRLEQQAQAVQARLGECGSLTAGAAE